MDDMASWHTMMDLGHDTDYLNFEEETTMETGLGYDVISRL